MAIEMMKEIGITTHKNVPSSFENLGEVFIEEEIVPKPLL